MKKFVKAFESYGTTQYPIQEFNAPEYEILTPEVEAKIVAYLNHYYVERWGKELKIYNLEPMPEFGLKAKTLFLINGVTVKYEEVES